MTQNHALQDVTIYRKGALSSLNRNGGMGSCEESFSPQVLCCQQTVLDSPCQLTSTQHSQGQLLEDQGNAAFRRQILRVHRPVAPALVKASGAQGGEVENHPLSRLQMVWELDTGLKITSIKKKFPI